MTMSLAAPALQLARYCWLEAGGSEADCNAIYWIGRRRAGERWGRFLRNYTKLYARTNPRARRIALLPWGYVQRDRWVDPKGWVRIQSYALGLLHGLYPVRYPAATDWGSPTDKPSSKLVRIENTGTLNFLYGRGSRS